MQKQIFKENYREGNFAKFQFSFWVKQTRVVQPVWAVIQRVFKDEIQVFPIHHQGELILVKKKDIFPIEITHEILRKGGFNDALQFLDVAFLFNIDRNTFTVLKRSENNKVDILGEVIYLHHFQNIYFQLYGKDFLFKVELFD